MRILVVEPEQSMNRHLVKHISHEGYAVDSCFSGLEAHRYFSQIEYDAVILNTNLPDGDGIKFLSDMRQAGIQIPVMLISSEKGARGVVKGLDAGADDYLMKPFDYREMLARLRVILRRKVEVRENIYRFCDLEIDTNQKRVTRSGTAIQVSPREYAILLYLIRNQNFVVTRQQIMDNIYSFDQDISSNVIDVYVRLLRKKIDAGHERKLIHTIRGMGYVMR